MKKFRITGGEFYEHSLKTLATWKHLKNLEIKCDYVPLLPSFESFTVSQESEDIKIKQFRVKGSMDDVVTAITKLKNMKNLRLLVLTKNISMPSEKNCRC